ncbi:protein phosphatase 2C domain-containing protein [Cognatitamlana onchidii]|uniref:protein phosphatase 2C domain-containing protein n=1 Tax=Cognatitamlana onchidii TaxID=2562860 RepID=UPI0010A6879C|nr:protein phosphatase 2C domain-containing protein [Algibacter onchidii]
MQILSIHKRSIYHPHFSEDFFYSYQLTDHILVCAVMDGCSSAKDSHFSSALFSKSIHKSCRMLPQMKEIVEDFDLATMELNEIGNFILKQLFDDLKKTKRLFFLSTEELLSTLSLLIYNHDTLKACIKISGDGLFAINGRITSIDQNNVPNFLGYHLAKNFEDVKLSAIATYNFENANDVCIATDGIDKLRKDLKNPEEINETRYAFLVEKPSKKSDLFFEKQYKKLALKGFTLYDDLSIMRIINPKD